MKREDYENFKWYFVTDETFWVEQFPDEFPKCRTVVRPSKSNSIEIYTQLDCYIGWGTMAKQENWYFMIIDLNI